MELNFMRKAYIKFNRIDSEAGTGYTQGSCEINGKVITSRDYVNIKRKLKSYYISDTRPRDPWERLSVIRAQVGFGKKSFNNILSGKRQARIKIG